MFLMLLAAILWGVTNPFLKYFSKGIEAKGSAWEDVKFLFSRKKYLFVQICNLLGSICFFYGLRDADISVGSIVANSLAFVITVLTSSMILKEKLISLQAGLGCFLVILGTGFCTISSM